MWFQPCCMSCLYKHGQEAWSEGFAFFCTTKSLLNTQSPILELLRFWPFMAEGSCMSDVIGAQNITLCHAYEQHN